MKRKGIHRSESGDIYIVLPESHRDVWGWVRYRTLILAANGAIVEDYRAYPNHYMGERIKWYSLPKKTRQRIKECITCINNQPEG